MFGNYQSPGATPSLFQMGIPQVSKGGFGGGAMPHPTVGNQNFGEVVGGLLQTGNQNPVKLKDIKWALDRFPELTYHLSAIATFTSFANTMPWANRRAMGPAGINVTFTPKKTSSQLAAQVVSNALTKLTDSGISAEEITAVVPHLEQISEAAAAPDYTDKDLQQISIMKEICGELIEANKVQQKCYKATLSLLMYSICVFDYSEEYSTIEIYSPDELVLEKQDDSRTDWKGTGIGKADVKIKVAATGEELSERAGTIVIGNGNLRESVVGKVIHYLRIVDLIETAMSVERVTKSISFLVWMVGVDGMPGEQVSDYLGAYRGIVMSRLKAGMRDNNIISAEVSKTLTATHLFVPTYKDSPTDVKNFNLQYRPMMDDLNYWWQKIFMSMGIPPYYSDIEKLQGSSGSVTHFHESVFGANVRAYQDTLSSTLQDWVKMFLGGVIGKDVLDSFTTALTLPVFVSSGEEARSEYMARMNQFASAYSTLSVSGFPIRPDFATQLLFPNIDPNDVVDYKVRNLGLGNTPEQTGQGDLEEYDDSVADSLIGNMVAGQLQAPPGDEESNRRLSLNELLRETN